jgi:hypothetical protein
MKLGVRSKLRNWIYTPNLNPVLVFGFPKSGTSAISALLAHRTNKSLTLDTKYLWEPYLSEIKEGKIEFDRHIRRFSYPFSKAIIKEPNMVFITDKILPVYSNAKILVIKRDKLDNIKSILDRLKIPGNLKENPEYSVVNRNWRSLLFSKDEHYVDVLNKHYKEAEIKLNMLKPQNPVFITYENFKKDKEKEIDRIANELNLAVKQNINHLLNEQFQPKSKNIESTQEFFGENLKKLI